MGPNETQMVKMVDNLDEKATKLACVSGYWLYAM